MLSDDDDDEVEADEPIPGRASGKRRRIPSDAGSASEREEQPANREWQPGPSRSNARQRPDCLNDDDDDDDDDDEDGLRMPGRDAPHRRGDGEADIDSDSEGDEELDAAHVRRQAAQRANARHLRRHNAEKAYQPGDVVRYGYLTELYNSPRYKTVLDGGFRYTVAVHVLLYYEEEVDAAEDGAVPTSDPSFLFRKRASTKGWSTKARFEPRDKLPKLVCYGGGQCVHTPCCGRATATPLAGGVDSRRTTAAATTTTTSTDDDQSVVRPTSPAAIVRPSHYASASGHADSGLHLEVAYFHDAISVLACVLAQYATAQERVARCRRELGLLAQAVARDLDLQPTKNDDARRARRRTRRRRRVPATRCSSRRRSRRRPPRRSRGPRFPTARPATSATHARRAGTPPATRLAPL